MRIGKTVAVVGAFFVAGCAGQSVPVPTPSSVPIQEHSHPSRTRTTTPPQETTTHGIADRLAAIGEPCIDYTEAIPLVSSEQAHCDNMAIGVFDDPDDTPSISEYYVNLEQSTDPEYPGLARDVNVVEGSDWYVWTGVDYAKCKRIAKAMKARCDHTKAHTVHVPQVDEIEPIPTQTD